jgi:hypothetical protein
MRNEEFIETSRDTHGELLNGAGDPFEVTVCHKGFRKGSPHRPIAYTHGFGKKCFICERGEATVPAAAQTIEVDDRT